MEVHHLALQKGILAWEGRDVDLAAPLVECEVIRDVPRDPIVDMDLGVEEVTGTKPVIGFWGRGNSCLRLGQHGRFPNLNQGPCVKRVHPLSRRAFGRNGSQ